MNVNAASISNQYAQVQTSFAAAGTQVKKRDNDGDYDNGAGLDDVAKNKALQVAAQPHLGSNINIQA